MSRPNLFDFATSELSQDAFVAWLADWARIENRSIDHDLNTLGLKFLKRLFEAARIQPPHIDSVTVKRQVHKVDVVIECITADSATAILIEDKIHTRQHSNQLPRYLKAFEADATYRNVVPIYFQMGDQSDYTEVEESGFFVFHRSDLLQLFEEDGLPTNDILKDYYERLRRIEDETQAYQSRPLPAWTQQTWIGLFSKLRTELGGHWGHINNEYGGFMALWYDQQHWQPFGLYVQLEQEYLRCRIHVEKEDIQSSLRNKWSEFVLQAAVERKLPMTKPHRFGKGTTMAIAESSYLHFEGEKLDVDRTIENVRAAEQVIGRAIHIHKYG